MSSRASCDALQPSRDIVSTNREQLENPALYFSKANKYTKQCSYLHRDAILEILNGFKSDMLW